MTAPRLAQWRIGALFVAALLVVLAADPLPSLGISDGGTTAALDDEE